MSAAGGTAYDSDAAAVEARPIVDPADPEQMAVRLLAGTFNCTMQLSTARNIAVSGHYFIDDDPASIHKRVDMAQRIIDRQYIKTDIHNKQAQIEGQRANLQQMAEIYTEHVKKQTAGRKLTSQELAQIKAYDQSVKGVTNAIESLEAAIAAAEKKLQDMS